MKLEFSITIILGIIFNIVLALLFYSIKEVPYWAKYSLGAGFTIAVGMVLMTYMMYDLVEEIGVKNNDKNNNIH